jgi:hypothetical protein
VRLERPLLLNTSSFGRAERRPERICGGCCPAPSGGHPVLAGQRFPGPPDPGPRDLRRRSPRAEGDRDPTKDAKTTMLSTSWPWRGRYGGAGERVGHAVAGEHAGAVRRSLLDPRAGGRPSPSGTSRRPRPSPDRCTVPSDLEEQPRSEGLRRTVPSVENRCFSMATSALLDRRLMSTERLGWSSTWMRISSCPLKKLSPSRATIEGSRQGAAQTPRPRTPGRWTGGSCRTRSSCRAC